MISRKLGIGTWQALPDKTSAVCLADSEGVVSTSFLELAMGCADRSSSSHPHRSHASQALHSYISKIRLLIPGFAEPPVLLKPLLESTDIVKQTVGAPTSVKQLLKERDPWKMRPDAFLDLRGMALQLYPELFADTAVSHVEFLQMMVKEFLGQEYNSSTSGSRVRVSSLRGTAVLEGEYGTLELLDPR